MVTSLVTPVCYLEITDFDSATGRLTQPQLRDHPVFIMIQAGFCGYCDQAKPAFQQLADSGIVQCASMQPDGDLPSEKALSSIVPMVYPDFPGYPSYVLLDGKGTSFFHVGGRDVESMTRFLQKHL